MSSHNRIDRRHFAAQLAVGASALTAAMTPLAAASAAEDKPVADKNEKGDKPTEKKPDEATAPTELPPASQRMLLASNSGAGSLANGMALTWLSKATLRTRSD